MFLGGPAAAATSSQCTLAKIAEIPVRVVRNKLVVDGAINGKSVGIMLDTGAQVSLITRPAADRLGLIRRKVLGARMFGVGGESDIDSALVDELKVGDATAKSRQMIVSGEHEIGDDVAVILGEDFFRVVDLEFDLAHKTVRLFQAKNCDGTSLAYWAPSGASEAAIERVSETNPSIVLPVEINGQPMRALFDSGAGASVLNRSDAARAGVAADGGRSGTTGGLGPSPVDWTVATVKSFTIGDETIRDTSIDVADLQKGAHYKGPGSMVPQNVDRPPMLLGADFLRSHRVLVAHSQGKLYFTYLGGPVFQPRNATSAKSDPDRAIADYDAAIKSDPQNAAAYFQRANAWLAKKDYDRAIADYDASLRIDPGRASSFVNRGTAKQRSGDFDGAIVDWTRAVELDPKLAAGHNQLAWAWATAERPSARDGRRAVDSALKACELTQWKNPSYLDTLAAAYARAGNFEEAVKWERKALEGPDLSDAAKAAERLRLYEEGKPWPSD